MLSKSISMQTALCNDDEGMVAGNPSTDDSESSRAVGVVHLSIPIAGDRAAAITGLWLGAIIYATPNFYSGLSRKHIYCVI